MVAWEALKTGAEWALFGFLGIFLFFAILVGLYFVVCALRGFLSAVRDGWRGGSRD